MKMPDLLLLSQILILPRWIDLPSWIDLSGIGATLAVILSLANSNVLWRQSGRAALQIRLEMVTLNQGPECRVVIFNGGHGDAHKVNLVFKNENQSWRQIPKVMSQQAYPLAWDYARDPRVPEDAEVYVSWEDGRTWKKKRRNVVYVAKYVRT